MKKYFLMLLIALIVSASGCSSETSSDTTEYVRPEQPHLYWKDIDVIITDIEKRRSIGKYRHYTVTIEVESDEYGITGNCRYTGAGMFGVPHQWNYEVGQTVKAKLNSWVMDSTGEVIRREISQVY